MLLRFGSEFGTLSIVSLWTYNQKQELSVSVNNTVRNFVYLEAFIDMTYLHAMYAQARACVEFFVANVAFEMFCLLVLNEDLFVVKFSVTIPIAQLVKEACELSMGNVDLFQCQIYT